MAKLLPYQTKEKKSMFLKVDQRCVHLHLNNNIWDISSAYLPVSHPIRPVICNDADMICNDGLSSFLSK